MAFHPYPRVIPSVFNLSGFGPPRGLTPASACPWIDHPASRPRSATHVAILKARFHFGSLQSLTSPRSVTRWLILQKARRHAAMGAPTACRRTVSGTVSLPSRGAFHLSLTVLVRYRSQESTQPWRVVPPASDRVSRARPYSGTGNAAGGGSRTGLSPASAGLSMPFRSPARFRPHARAGARAIPAPQPRRGNAPRLERSRRFGLDPLSLAATRGVSVDFLSSGYLDVSVPPVASLHPILFGCGRPGTTPGGFPHSGIPGSKAVCASPGLIAACRALHRLPVPRHPPCALDTFSSVI